MITYFHDLQIINGSTIFTGNYSYVSIFSNDKQSAHIKRRVRGSDINRSLFNVMLSKSCHNKVDVHLLHAPFTEHFDYWIHQYKPVHTVCVQILPLHSQCPLLIPTPTLLTSSFLTPGLQ